MELYKYQGAGNDFIVADNRDGKITLTPEQITKLCDRRYGIGADGLMLLEDGGEDYDFKMLYFNSDGTGGMMCGNGGRCIVAFAEYCGIDSFNFIASDGPHEAEILSQFGNAATVKLKMKDVDEIVSYPQPDIDGWFLDTGTRHLVCKVDNVADYDVYGEGKRLRYRDEFAPIGVNVNFIEPDGKNLKIRSYEKGVEDETYACGTGITASAIAAWHNGIIERNTEIDGVTPVHVDIKALHDRLAVDFIPTPNGAKDVYLTGPTNMVARIYLD